MIETRHEFSMAEEVEGDVQFIQERDHDAVQVPLGPEIDPQQQHNRLRQPLFFKQWRTIRMKSWRYSISFLLVFFLCIDDFPMS